MKKLIAIVLLSTILWLSCACSSNGKSASVAKQYEYYSPFNIYYGMSKEDCMKALGIKESDITQTDQSEHGYSFYINKEFLGYKVNAGFEFTSKDYSQGNDIGLTAFGVLFKEKPKLNKILPKVQAELKKNGLSYSEPTNNIANVEFYNTKLMNSFNNNSSTKDGHDLNPSSAYSIDMIALQSRELKIKPGDNPDIFTIAFRGYNAAILYQEEHK